jgi:hypothetical protein
VLLFVCELQNVVSRLTVAVCVCVPRLVVHVLYVLPLGAITAAAAAVL